jgi:hypothetical protein
MGDITPLEYKRHITSPDGKDDYIYIYKETKRE